jgi:cytochrome c-type biogenesis protein CcmH
LAVRERLVAGDSDAETVAYIVARYGEFALLKPTLRGSNLVLWLAGPLMLLLAVGLGGAFIWRSGRRSEGDDQLGGPSGDKPSEQKAQTKQTSLSSQEQARLDELLRE